MAGADSLWYKDAVFYELHVKAFQDSNGDGIGDFRGLIDRLDYIRDLGVDAVWLLPFYPSPLRDDGYDIADYFGINPQYGTIDDFQLFVDEAHKRGLRVIADLVLNHTSNDHAWFQRARRAPKGSPERDYYVWSDSDELYKDARIIFTDTEPSNWTWDPVAGQYYWHRFFAHQPDLNWDNPEVKEEMFQIMEYWLDRGLDGFRCDAVPYLIEREGTICENLPETHDILKEFRTRLDGRYQDRILLAEANQWPDDVRPYFGDGDEFHMAFHFPLMPRIFMAVRQGIRKPIVEIIQRTPDIPEGCQWCMFLRNHDELTLEMVTDEERDYMYNEYASDSRMRLNLGIRRRLAPLLDNDRRKIELLNSILFTMPGSPIIYYGDELGMGDNIYLGDRDGVRTPMQWTPDRNAGFSRAEAARLYQPTIVDSVYGFQAINVEAQQRSPFSLLNWMKRLVQVRKQHRAFGRGTIEFLVNHNPHVLAYLREYEGDLILVVSNLSGSAQPVRLDLSRFAGRVPVELLGRTEFLPIDETPYALALGPYGFFWFGLQSQTAAQEESVHLNPGEWAQQEVESFERAESVASMVAGIPHAWLAQQRWFRSKSREIAAVEMHDRAVLAPERDARAMLTVACVRYAEGRPELYLLPLAMRPMGVPGTEPDPVLTHATDVGELGVYEALEDRYVAGAVLRAMAGGVELQGTRGEFSFRGTDSLRQIDRLRGSVRRIAAEQSNTSLVIGDELVLKVFRKLEPGINPDLEVTRFLAERTDFRAMPGLEGWVEYHDRDGWSASVAGLFEFVPNTGDAWSYTRRALGRFLAAASRSAADPSSTAGRQAARRMTGDFVASVRQLGTVTGELHAALAGAGADSPDFVAEPITAADVREWTDDFRRNATATLAEVARRLEAMPGGFPLEIQTELAAVCHQSGDLVHQMNDLRILEEVGLSKIRFHGDYHLGQLLRRADAQPGAPDEWVILDFEGEPARPIADRRVKHSALRDVAGMLRSFDYAVRMALREQPAGRSSGRAGLDEWAEAWMREVRTLFLRSYHQAVSGMGLVPDDPNVLRRALAVFELEKAIYELGYELNNRPEWIWVPVRGIQAIMRGEG